MTTDPITAATEFNTELLEQHIDPVLAEAATHGFLRGLMHREKEES
ncbi:hypothetical protein ACHABQ_03065 [Nesterenkonia aurantiaca]